MSYIRTYVEVDTTLFKSNNYMEDDSAYAEYLNEDINKTSKIEDVHLHFVSDHLGSVYIQIYFDGVIEDKWNSSVQVKFTVPEQMSDEAVYDAFEADYKLQAFLKENVENFIKDANEKLEIYHPINENLIFRNGLYMEISKGTYKHTPEWVKLQLESNIDQQSFIDNMIRTQY